jgi:hypothetical protein
VELQVDSARIGGWIFVHTHGETTVSFGPFEDYEDLRMWLETIGDDNNISGMAIPLVNPASNPERFNAPLYQLIEEPA